MIGFDEAAWNGLLERIGAHPSTWRYSGAAPQLIPEWQVKLAGIGIEVDLDEIEVDGSTGLYLFRGQQVLIYIKFTRRPREVLEQDKQASPRFHFRDCKTIQDMKARKRYQRYVAISRTDGWFPVVSEEEVGGNHELEAQLGPCKWCLGDSRYRNYASAGRQQQHEIWDAFSIPDFFAAYSSSLSAIPIDSCDAVDSSTYAAGWALKSEEVRSKAGWRCSLCSVHLVKHRRLLQVHHVDGDKSNNWLYNLRPLCILCHQAKHSHKMYIRPEDALTIERLREEQGLSS